MANNITAHLEITSLEPQSVHRRQWEDMLVNEYGATQFDGDAASV